MSACSVQGCRDGSRARGLCNRHYKRLMIHGDPLFEAVISGRPLRGDVPTIHAIHKRLTRGRGPARNFACVDCSAPAQEWSYSGTDPAQLWGEASGFLMPYSLDLAFYDPRCVSCHRKHDGAGNRPRTTKGRFKRSTNQAGVTA